MSQKSKFSLGWSCLVRFSKSKFLGICCYEFRLQDANVGHVPLGLFRLSMWKSRSPTGPRIMSSSQSRTTQRRTLKRSAKMSRASSSDAWARTLTSPRLNSAWNSKLGSDISLVFWLCSASKQFIGITHSISIVALNTASFMYTYHLCIFP